MSDNIKVGDLVMPTNSFIDNAIDSRSPWRKNDIYIVIDQCVESQYVITCYLNGSFKTRWHISNLEKISE